MAQISYWGFDEGTARDTSVANGPQDGVLRNGADATFGSLETNGFNQYVEVAPDPAFQLSQGTLITEFSADRLHTGTIFSRDSWGNDNGGHFFLRVLDDGSIESRQQTVTTNFTQNTAANFYAAGDDIRVTFSWDNGSGGAFTVENLTQGTTFSEGVPAGVTWDQGAFNEPITIGANQNLSGDNTADNLQQFFDGSIDYVSVHDTPETYASSGLLGDGVVRGSSGDDLIDENYVDAADGERIDANDGIFGTTGDQDIVKAGAGNDTVLAGAGNDIVNGGMDDDSVLGGAGDDMLFGDIQTSGAAGQNVTSLQLNIANLRAGTDTPNQNAAVEGDSVIYDNVGFLDDGRAIAARLTLVSRTNENLQVDLSGVAGGEIITNRNNDPAMEGESATFRIEFLDPATDLPISLTGRATWGDIDEAVGGAEAIAISDEEFYGYETAVTNQLSLSEDDGTYTATGASGGVNLDPSDQSAWYSGLFADQSDITFTATTRGANSGFSLNGDVIADPDTVLFRQGDDTLRGGSGDDTLLGNGGADLLVGGNEADSLFGGTGNDTLWGDAEGEATGGVGHGNDTLRGGEGDDIAYGGGGADVIIGGAGNDTLFGGDGNDSVTGGTGEDVLDGGQGSDTLDGGAGNDVINAADDTTGRAGGATDPDIGDSILGGTGSDTIFANGSDTVNGGEDGDGSDIDVLNVTNVASLQYTDGAGAVSATPTENGTVTFHDGSTLTFTNIETVNAETEDGYVEGDAGDNLIDATYLDDPDGDRIDNDDAVFAGEAPDDDIILAGGGDDTVNAGAGDDRIYGDSQVIGANADGTGGNGSATPWRFEYYDLDPTGNPTDLAAAGFTANDGRDNTNPLTASGVSDSIIPSDYDTADDYALKFTSELYIEQGGFYDFSTSSDDGSKLFIDGIEVVTNDGLHPLQTENGFVALDPGPHLVEIIYFENNGANQLSATMSGPDTGGNPVDLASFPGLVDPNLNSSAGDDILNGGAGDDMVFGQGGDDRLVLTDSFGNDTLVGGETGETDGDTLAAGSVTAPLTVTFSGPEAGTVSDGSDTATFSEIEALETGTGNDTVNAILATDGIVADTDAGQDSIIGGIGTDVIDSGAGGDNITSGGGNDTIEARAGDDYIDAGTGADLVFGGAGNDTVDGGDSSDTLWGGTDADQLSGGNGDDVISGGAPQAAVFNADGTDGVALASNVTDFPTDAITFETRFTADAIGNGQSSIFSYATQSSNNEFLVFARGGTLEVFINGAAIDTGVSAASLFDGTSHALSVSWDSATGSLKTYVDGVETSDQVHQTGRPLEPGGTIAFGQEQDSVGGSFSTAQLFDGAIEEARLWRDVRSPEEVAQFHDTRLGTEVANPDLVSDWLPAADRSGLEDIAGDNDAPFAGAAFVSEDVSDGADRIIGGGGNDTMYGDGGDDAFILANNHGTDSIAGGETNETDGDLLDAGSVTDNTTVTFTDDEAGTLSHATGSATFSEIERIQLGDGDDTVDAGADSAGVDVIGGAGNDQFTAGAGADRFVGGDDADTFRFDAPGAAYGDTIDGGAGGDDNDTLDLTGTLSPGGTYAITETDDADGTSTSGTVQFFDAGGGLEGILTFSEIENIVPCFTPGTRIATDRGGIRVEELRLGDLVKTRDNGLQPIRWIGTKALKTADLALSPQLRPIRIARGALGAHLPLRDMRVSPQHRFLVAGPGLSLNLGLDEALVTAAHLTSLEGIQTDSAERVTYIHLMFDTHEVILSDGCWTESFQPGDSTLCALDDAPRAELEALFPALFEGGATYQAARPTLRRFEAQIALEGLTPPAPITLSVAA